MGEIIKPIMNDIFQMRVAHLGTDQSLICSKEHVTFDAAVQEIGAWLDDHEGEFIRIYMNVSYIIIISFERVKSHGLINPYTHCA